MNIRSKLLSLQSLLVLITILALSIFHTIVNYSVTPLTNRVAQGVDALSKMNRLDQLTLRMDSLRRDLHQTTHNYFQAPTKLTITKYEFATTKLREAINTAISNTDEGAAFSNISVLESNIEEIEKTVFRFVAQGDIERASMLLESVEYQVLSENYESFIKQFNYINKAKAEDQFSKLVSLSSDIETGKRRLSELVFISSISFVSICLIGFILSMVISRSISKPLERLAKGAEIIGRGNLDHVVPLSAGDVVGGVYGLLSSMFARSLQRFTQAKRRIAGGDLKVKAGISPKDEITLLTGSFNKMTQRLAESMDELVSAKEHTDNIIASMIDMLIVMDPDAKIRMVNPAISGLLGYQEQELVGKDISVIFPEEEVSIFKGARLQKLIEKGALQEYAMTYRTKTGDRIPVSFSVSVMRDGDRNPVGIVGIARDMREINRLRKREKAFVAAEVTAEAERKRAGELAIFNDRMRQANEQLRGEITERERAEDRIGTSLKEKDVLLKEVHHRVKNNLQLISSLLNLEASSGERDPQKMFQDSQHRVRAMAFIHEGLYQSKDLARVEFGEYIRTLTAHLMQSYGVNGHAVTLKTDVKTVALGVDLAIPCGLILNELVSNALKHAFPDGRTGEIRVALHVDSVQQLILQVSDNGVGIPPEVDVRNAATLGLQLVTTLTEQVGGTLELQCEGGTTFTLTCPLETEERGRG